jgi:hypothetical protein
MPKQLMIYNKLFCATAQEGAFTCGAAAVCNACYFLTGKPLAEWQLRSQVKAPMVTHGIVRKASALYYGDDETGAPGSSLEAPRRRQGPDALRIDYPQKSACQPI